MLSRIIYGARTALAVGFLVVAPRLARSARIIGVVSAYFGGKTDMIIQRFMDVLLVVPDHRARARRGGDAGQERRLRASTVNLIIAIGMPMVPRVARVVRASALAVRELPYIDAARTAGFSHARIIFRHMVPNVVAPYLIMLTAFVGAGDPARKRRCRSSGWA